ncbi:MAG: hypothetical protein KIT31_11430 [Deltaproteobacteria bacterium]|nr:hypothetical protein [Deltaproteobacteria bacterium]
MSAANELSMSVAVHHDTDLAASPRALEILVETLCGTASPSGELRHWYTPLKGKRTSVPPPFHLARMMKLVDRGVWAIAVQAEPETPAADELLVVAQTAPGARSSQTRCRYDADAAFGPARLRELGAQRALDAMIAFADAVGARAGVVHWARSTAYVKALATYGGSSITHEQSVHIGDLMYWQPRWGDVIRGPAWGTVLAPAHVDRLGGVDRVRAATGAHVQALRSGGAYVQATPIDAPLVEDRDELPARLIEALAPVMGQR